MKVDLAITGACAATALGFGAEWGMHAVRCGSSRLELQRLPDRAREWIPGGRVPLQGPGLYENRLAELAAVTARTALDRAGFASPRGLRLAVLLGLPDEVGRPGHSFPGPDRELSGWLGEVLGVVPVEVATMAFGSCSAQGCLARASELLARRGVEACLVGAADSLLQLRIVRWLEEQGRLACSYANDGLRPGEGTAFFVVESSERAATRKAPVLARVLATTARQEEATIESDRPNTARGLTDAARAALVEAGVPARAVGSVFADLNGESYKAREWAVCETRLGIAADVALVHPADAYGDLGVATDAGLVALAAMALASDWLPGPALVFAGADIGIRACSVLVAAPERAAGVAQVTRLQPAIVPAGFELSSLGPDDPDPAEAEDPTYASFHLSVRRELAGSLAFLYYQRRNLLDGDEEHWTRIGGCERRLLEHIDAIVAGGARMAWSVASGVLDGEPGLAFGGAMVLATIGSEAAFGCLLEVIGQIDEAALPAVADALRHAPGSAALTAALEQMRRAERPAVAAMALDVQSYRRDLPAAIVLPLLAGSDPVLRRAAIVAAIRGGSSAHAEPVLRAVRELEAHELGLPGLLRLDRGLALSVAREHSNPGDPAFGVALLTRAVAADTTVTGLLREGVRSPAVATAALDAVGALGDVGFVPLLLQALASEAASAAASALRRITGADLREEADVADPDDPEAAVRVERISQDPAVWTRWWQDHGERMAASHRHRFGLRYGATAIAAELEARGRLSERNRACFELELALDKPVLAADWFVARQHAFLGDLAGRRATR